ncbi:hypothetical protein B0J11DRAFT_250255 [Dendryphion nanum]|uniref:Uncharacterized protein n=1 Tax=Dendryphion nanum TaxID=256645 RepID=A0A9P9E2P7_9PLEO|nr:hypothetical protein B0J11DRAFT_250255 [Dendryphion nanum]
MNTSEKQKSSVPEPSPHSSAIPLLSETKPAEDEDTQESLAAKAKRRLFGLGKQKEGEKTTATVVESAPESTNSPSPASPPPHTRTISPTSAPALTASPPPDHRPSPRGSPRIFPAGAAVSPNRRVARSSSPGLLHSPASSQIFERNVQESVSDLSRSELSPHLPAHIQTEDHIPSVLEASSLAITDDHLNPDEVEIVMHSAHQPASTVVTGRPESVYALSQEDLPVSISGFSEAPDSTSNYGSLDTTDIRRLSFISFADVVQAEQVENDRDTVQFMSLSSTANRSPSPVRSPASSHGFSTSPPTSGLGSGAASEKGVEIGSPKAIWPPGSPPAHGELQIETMRQALRKMGSSDLGGDVGVRSQPLSAVSIEDSVADQAPFKK